MNTRSLAPLLGAMLWISSSPVSAENTPPEWKRLKVCLDANLATQMRSNEPIETVWKAVRTSCKSEIVALESSLVEQYRADPEVTNELEPEEIRPLIDKEIEKTLFDYAVSFKAAGGPTSLAPD